MDREFIHTREKLEFLLREVLQNDVLGNPQYLASERAEEGFEKRAALEFLMWFLHQAIPAELTFPYTYENLEEEYPESIARVIAEGKGWAASRLRDQGGNGNVVMVDFKPKK